MFKVFFLFISLKANDEKQLAKPNKLKNFLKKIENLNIFYLLFAATVSTLLSIATLPKINKPSLTFVSLIFNLLSIFLLCLSIHKIGFMNFIISMCVNLLLILTIVVLFGGILK